MINGPVLKFKAKGWLFDKKEDQLIIPMLKNGTCIEFKKDNCTLKLYYDAIVPSSSTKTNIRNNPIYTLENHNRPDARLDIYLDNKYMNSIIFEFKYRTIKSFWHKNSTTSYNQIISYRNGTYSKFTRGLPEKEAKERKAVSEVWVFHPTGKNENEKQMIDKPDAGIKLIRLKPNEDYKNIVDELKNSIDNIILE
jgi:hypothetical protein